MLRRCVLSAVLTLVVVVTSSPQAGARGSSPRRVLVPARYQARVVRVFRQAQGGPSFSIGSFRGCPAAPTCDVYTIGRARWQVDSTGRAVMSYRYSDVGRPSRAPSTAGVESALERSAAELHHWNSNAVFVNASTTTARPGALGPDGSCADGVDAIGWRPLPLGVLGLTYICYDIRTYRIIDADTALNSVVPWASFSAPSPASTAFDVQEVLTHELAHWLSLLDVSSSRASRQTEYTYAKPGEIFKRTLALGDIAGIQTAYPCGPEDSCPRTGIVND